MPEAIEAVIFDVGRVLFHWDMRHLFRQLIEDRQELDWFLSNVVTEEWHFEHDRGRPLAEMLPERIAQYPEWEAHIQAYARRFNETIPGPVEGMPELLRKLYRRGTPLYAITNFGDEFWRQFRPTQPIFDLFLDIIVSGTERLAKPDPAIYRLAEQRFGHEPDAVLFIDDNPANIEAARTCGWRAHLFTDADKLEMELKALRLLD